MKKYHINPETGQYRECRATVKPCKYGVGTPHYDTTEEARAAAEKLFNKQPVISTSKKQVSPTSTINNVVNKMSQVPYEPLNPGDLPFKTTPVTEIHYAPGKTIHLEKEIVDKYDLETKMEKGSYYQVLMASKRGHRMESFSNSRNMWMRAAKDNILKDDTSYSMMFAWRVGAAMFDGNCYICNEPVYDKEKVHPVKGEIQADHIYSSNFGGSGAAGNMLAAHRMCNDLKEDRHFEDFMRDEKVQEKLNFTPEVAEQNIAKVKDFQKLMNYTPADPVMLQKIDEKLNEIWDKMLGEVDEVREAFLSRAVAG